MAWDRVAGSGSPFLEHRVLSAFENADCAAPEHGWLPHHLVLERDGEVVAAAPMYVKGNSAGEFVFDWDWANAAHRLGVEYYPKLIAAVPFTPVRGNRVLVAPKTDPEWATVILARAAWEVCRDIGGSSVHWLFVTDDEAERLEQQGYALRAGIQYHWHNRGYESFDQWLEGFSSKRRRNIRRERRELREAGIEVEVFEGDDIDEDCLDIAFETYLDTIDKKVWGRQYLNRDFFHRLGTDARERTLFVQAVRGGAIIAAAAFLQKDGQLYGRYWGCFEEVRFLHFELCYYTPVELCIRRGWQRFDAGAQGSHKYERGFDPVVTWSAHRIADAKLDGAIRRYLATERLAVAREWAWMCERSPCRRVRANPLKGDGRLLGQGQRL